VSFKYFTATLAPLIPGVSRGDCIPVSQAAPPISNSLALRLVQLKNNKVEKRNMPKLNSYKR